MSSAVKWQIRKVLQCFCFDKIMHDVTRGDCIIFFVALLHAMPLLIQHLLLYVSTIHILSNLTVKFCNKIRGNNHFRCSGR